MAEHLELWPVFEPVIAPLLGEEDDPTLWSVVLETIYADAQALARLVTGPHRVLTQIGRCSHWLAPNKARWTADGSFAWPSGYGAIGFSFTGLPEFDWYGQWAWCPGSRSWMVTDGRPSSQDLVFRVAVPSRTLSTPPSGSPYRLAARRTTPSSRGGDAVLRVSAAHIEMVVHRLPVLDSYGSASLRGNRQGVDESRHANASWSSDP